MKNFSRLVRFAWPYRGRFTVSIGCAAMVALLWFTELGAVYPLLQILFNSQNAQRWVVEQIDEREVDIEATKARLEEIAEVPRLAESRQRGALENHIRAVNVDFGGKESRLREIERKIDESGKRGPNAALEPLEQSRLDRLRREHKIAEARVNEMRKAVTSLETADSLAIAHRKETLDRDLGRSRAWLARYRWIKPKVDRYLPNEGFKTLLLLLVLVMTGVAVKGFFLFVQEVVVSSIVQLTIFDIRNLFFRRAVAFDLARFNDQGTADLMARFTNDMESVGQGLNTLLSKVVREPLRIATCLGGALWLNWRLTLLALALIPLSAFTSFRAGKIMKRAIRKALESMSNIYKILQETFQGIKVVKAFTAERLERRRFFVETKRLYKKCVRVAMIDALSDPVLEILALSTVSIALLAGSYLVLRRTTDLDFGFFRLKLASRPMMIEDLLTLYTLLAGVSDPIRKLANVHSKIQRAAAAADRICALMDQRPTVVDKKETPRLVRHHSMIEFDHVHFSYDGREQVVRGVNLTVRHGETIALVGPNGCGKTTLMNLLPRFWDVDKGTIRIDGHDIREVRLRSVRAQMGIVTQETVLFQGTLADNIAYGSPHASRAAIEAAAKRSFAHQFISTFPEGYDTLVGERGMSLSGGQRQRIALARVMLRDPAILILDEATSAVDIQDEYLIRRAIEEFAKGRTTFLITHNLGSLQVADRIVLLNSGRVEAVGSDAELRKSSQLYRKLHEIHFQRESA
ncbi:MAG: ABC transporter ATP-binding protein [Isosphaeraceae bacterium]